MHRTYPITAARRAIARTVGSRRAWIWAALIGVVWSIVSPIAIILIVDFPAPLHEVPKHKSIPLEFSNAFGSSYLRNDRLGLTYKRARWDFGDSGAIIGPTRTALFADECAVGVPIRYLVGRWAFVSPPSSAAVQPEFDVANVWASDYGITWTRYFLGSAFPNHIDPGTILWARFMLNIVVVSATAIAVLVSLSGFRAMRRAARSRCIVCGFDLKGIPANRCPECGFTFDVPS